MEIDGIALKNNHCFIIEVKGKTIPTLYMNKKRRDSLVRDAKGIVDGYKYIKNLRTVKPSLLEKIEYVKQNYKKFGIADKDKVEFHGIVVSRFYQGISEYRGIKFIVDYELENYLKTIYN